MFYVAAASISFLLVFAIIPLFRRIAAITGFLDRPNNRKIHVESTPLLGGVAIYLGIVLVLFIFTGLTMLSLCIALGGLLLVTIGLMDDGAKSKGKDFPVWPRVIVYIAASALPLLFHIRIIGVTNPGPGSMLLFPYGISAAATMIWIFALINMINFIDGVDGLASGVAIISSITLFVAAILRGQSETALLAVILIGACTAFLTFNFHPARIFMGDAGAAFLGYTLAVIAVSGSLKSTTFVSMLVPLLALGVPILDTAVVMLRRLFEGKGLHKADKLHTHHALMRWGLTQTQTVSFIYLVASVFALLSIVLLLAWG